MVWGLRNVIVTIINLALAVAMFFLGLRFAFSLFGANPATPFVSWVYSISDSLIAPFAGIFGNLVIGNFVVDIVALVAMVAYSLLAYLVIALLDAVTAPTSIEQPHTHTHY